MLTFFLRTIDLGIKESDLCLHFVFHDFVGDSSEMAEQEQESQPLLSTLVMAPSTHQHSHYLRYSEEDIKNHLMKNFSKWG